MLLVFFYLPISSLLYLIKFCLSNDFVCMLSHILEFPSKASYSSSIPNVSTSYLVM